MTDTAARIAEIEARAEKATEGPWEEVPGDRGHIVSGLQPDLEKPPGTIYDWNVATVHGPFCDRPPTDLFDGTPNCAFIAHAREDVPWLISALRSATAREAELQSEIEKMKAQHHRTFNIACDHQDRANAAEKREAELRAALKVHETAIMEVRHAMAVGPEWYTKGESGLRAQVRMWLDKADKARAALASTKPEEKENG